MQNPLSRLDSYGYLHFWFNQSERFLHEKFSFTHTNNVDRMWRSFRASISTLRTLKPTLRHTIGDYLDSFMFRSIANPNFLREFTLKTMKDYYDIQRIEKSISVD